MQCITCKYKKSSGFIDIYSIYDVDNEMYAIGYDNFDGLWKKVRLQTIVPVEKAPPIRQSMMIYDIEEDPKYYKERK